MDPSWLDDETLAAVRPQVRQLLERSPAFQSLSTDKQRDIARNMVRVAAYLSNPQGLARAEFERPSAEREKLARSLAGPVDDAKAKASAGVGRPVGKDFEAGALRQGTESFRDLVGAVDFPVFVGGLIQNVFQAIVNASIQQMNAYGALLKGCSQAIDQFAQENFSLDNARGYLLERFPDDLMLDESGGDDEEGGGHPRIVPRGEDNDALLGQINADFSPDQPITDLSDPAQETRLVMAARLAMAKSRQQMLSTMVMLGINRIVVTDGQINAKVLFELKANDSAQRRARAALSDTQSSYNKNVSAAGAHFGWGAAGSVNVNEQKHVTAVSSSVDETSESKAELKAKLSGEVRVNFKSDYFPMEKLATPGMIASIQGNATPFNPNAPPPAARPGASPAPAAPARA
jgi:hypothetical protein